MIKVAFLIIGTNKYFKLAEQCADSILQHVKVNGTVNPIIFTNAATANKWHRYELLHVEHKPWPLITLLRYHTFHQYRQELSQYDYLYYIDADMRFVKNVNFEQELMGNLVATKHPGYYRTPYHGWPFEQNQKSTAFVNKIPNTSNYYFGAFQGGNAKTYLEISEILRNRINEDLKSNYIAIWHDETQWNKYCWENQPDKILEPIYAWPEKWPNCPGEPKILALDKDHQEIRKEN